MSSLQRSVGGSGWVFAGRLSTGLLALALLTLPACGGGGGGGSDDGGGSPPAPADPATVLTPKATFDAADVAHLLTRTRFGLTAADLAAVAAQGVPAFVDAMLVFDPADPAGAAATASEVADPQFPQEHELVRWWLRVMQATSNPFREVLALFWHDHFATSQEILGSDKKWWWPAHLRLFRDGGAGNLRSLLLAVAQDWTMLEWLDGVRSTRNAPNENFAREFWELFTLGVDAGYTQADIVQASRCFTGYRTRFDDATGRSTVAFDAARHNTSTKTLLGGTIAGRSGADGAAEYADVVDLTLARRPVAEFIVRKLLEAFCYADPPPTVVDQLAAQLRAGGWELAPVLATLFKSEAFYSPTAKAGLAKSPVELALGFVRATGLRTHMDDLDAGVTDAGQRPTMPPNVAGWAGGALWFSAQALVERANYVRDCITHRGTDVQAGLDLRALLPAGAGTDAPGTVDALAALLRIPLSAADRATLIDYLGTQRQSNGTVVASPFDASNPTHVDERVRGLLYVLAQHPAYHLR